MSHYINLLEDSERHFHSAAKSSQLLRAGILAVAGAILIGTYLAVRNYQTTMRDAETLTKRWKTMEKEVETARIRLDQLTRLEREANSLQGWSTSRRDWQEILTFLQRRMPEPTDQFHFKRLFFDENMVGIRTLNPDTETYGYPLRRETHMEITGIVQGDRVEPIVADYEAKLRDGEDGSSPMQIVRLENITTLGPTEAKAPSKQFNFTLVLKPRPLQP